MLTMSQFYSATQLFSSTYLAIQYTIVHCRRYSTVLHNVENTIQFNLKPLISLMEGILHNLLFPRPTKNQTNSGHVQRRKLIIFRFAYIAVIIIIIIIIIIITSFTGMMASFTFRYTRKTRSQSTHVQSSIATKLELN